MTIFSHQTVPWSSISVWFLLHNNFCENTSESYNIDSKHALVYCLFLLSEKHYFKKKLKAVSIAHSFQTLILYITVLSSRKIIIARYLSCFGGYFFPKIAVV